MMTEYNSEYVNSLRETAKLLAVHLDAAIDPTQSSDEDAAKKLVSAFWKLENDYAND